MKSCTICTIVRRGRTPSALPRPDRLRPRPRLRDRVVQALRPQARAAAAGAPHAVRLLAEAALRLEGQARAVRADVDAAVREGAVSQRRGLAAVQDRRRRGAHADAGLAASRWGQLLRYGFVVRRKCV